MSTRVTKEAPPPDALARLSSRLLPAVQTSLQNSLHSVADLAKVRLGVSAGAADPTGYAEAAQTVRSNFSDFVHARRGAGGAEFADFLATLRGAGEDDRGRRHGLGNALFHEYTAAEALLERAFGDGECDACDDGPADPQQALAERHVGEVKAQVKEIVYLLFAARCDKDLLAQELVVTRDVVGRYGRKLRAGSCDPGALLRHGRDFDREIDRLKLSGELLREEAKLHADAALFAQGQLARVRQVVEELEHSFDGEAGVPPVPHRAAAAGEDHQHVGGTVVEARLFRKELQRLRSEKEGLQQEVDLQRRRSAEDDGRLRRMSRELEEMRAHVCRTVPPPTLSVQTRVRTWDGAESVSIMNESTVRGETRDQDQQDLSCASDHRETGSIARSSTSFKEVRGERSEDRARQRGDAELATNAAAVEFWMEADTPEEKERQRGNKSKLRGYYDTLEETERRRREGQEALRTPIQKDEKQPRPASRDTQRKKGGGTPRPTQAPPKTAAPSTTAVAAVPHTKPREKHVGRPRPPTDPREQPARRNRDMPAAVEPSATPAASRNQSREKNVSRHRPPTDPREQPARRTRDMQAAAEPPTTAATSRHPPRDKNVARLRPRTDAREPPAQRTRDIQAAVAAARSADTVTQKPPERRTRNIRAAVAALRTADAGRKEPPARRTRRPGAADAREALVRTAVRKAAEADEPEWLRGLDTQIPKCDDVPRMRDFHGRVPRQR